MPDPETLSQLGLPGLFVTALLAGSIVPIPSDALLAALVARGEPAIVSVVVATIGNTLGAATIFWLGGQLARGRGGPLGRWVQRRAEKNPARMARARARIVRWGPPALLLSWMPIAGDAVVLAAGFGGVRWTPFLVFVTLGKTLRFVTVAVSAAAVVAAL